MTFDDIFVELFYDGAWQDITCDVDVSDGAISITRGRADEGSKTDPGKCSLSISNSDGKYSPRNPRSPLYGKIGRNTPLRVRQADNVRFVGEVAQWPPRWDSPAYTWVPIEAAGILRRLGNANSPLRSALYRGTVASQPIAYWPLEDGEGSTQMASGLDGGEPMSIVRTPELAAFDGFVSSDPLPKLKDGQFVGRVGDYPYSQDELDWQLQFVAYLPDDEFLGTFLEVRTNDYVRRLLVETSPSGNMTLSAYSPYGTLLGSNDTGSDDLFSGRLVRVTLTFHGNASPESVRLEVLDIETGVASAALILLGHPSGHVTRVTLGDTALGDTAVGHVSLHSFAWLVPLEAQTNAYRGEAAARRIERLCSEEGIPLTIEGDPDPTAAMGPQAADTLLNLLRECSDADLGILGEQRDQIGLRYRTQESLYNRAVDVTLDYAAGELSPPLEPTEDDQHTANDVTVQRRGGSSGRAVKKSGPLSVQPPPEGVGRYDASLTLNLHEDDQVRPQAEWRMHLGTIDELRYPTVTVLLHGNPHLVDAISALDQGDRIRLTNLPDWMPPGAADLTVEGTAEELDTFWWRWSANTSPARVNDVFELNSATLGRLASDGSELNGALTASEATADVAVTAGMRWTTDVAQFPFDIVVGGEVMTVTGIVDSASTRTVLSDGYEDGTLGPFITSGDADWFVQTAESNSGSYAAQSGSVSHGQASQLTLTHTVPEGSTVSFAYKVSSESGWDFLEFYIDGAEQDSWSGEVTWTTSAQYPLGSGEHEFTWVYRKDGNTSVGSDAAWIDDITISGPVQTFTVTRSVNGVSKSHAAGSEVELHHPGVLALGQSGEDF